MFVAALSSMFRAGPWWGLRFCIPVPRGITTPRGRREASRRRGGAGRGASWEVPVAGLGDEVLLVHLGMSGQMLMKGPEEATHRHLRARVHLDDGNQLWFVDQRTFGYWSVVPLIDAPVPSAHQRIPASIAHIAPDLLDPTLDLSDLARAVKQKDTELKRVLLDQRVVSGIGNIYADEMLWQAGLHGRQRASKIATSRLVSLLEAGQSVMEHALLQGGTSFDDLYVNVNGESGYFDVSLNAYGQQGKPCPRCGDAIVREEFMNRGSHFCPTCQKEY